MKKIILLILLIIPLSWSYCLQSIGLALSGGGARGLAQVGVLKVLDEYGIKVDCVAGTSTGALIGGLYAMGYSGMEIQDMLLNISWRDLLNDVVPRRDYYIGEKRWKPYARYLFSLNKNFLPEIPPAFFSGHNLINTLFRFTYSSSSCVNFDAFPVPFRCTATNICNGELKVFSEGSLHEVIRASMSLPTIFIPFAYKGEYYIDGGVKANFPTEIVRNMGADLIIGVQTNSGLKNREELNSLITVLDQTVNFGITANVKSSAALADILIKPELDDFNLLDFDRVTEIIRAGEEAARAALSSRKDTLLVSHYPHNCEFISDKILVNEINIRGNNYLSKAKIKEFLNLKTGKKYSQPEIEQSVNNVFNSNLFEYVYPTLVPSGLGYQLDVHVKEKNRKHLALSFSYNEENEFIAGVTVELNNYLQRNSKMLCNLKLGNITEINLDYVKNFGKTWGIYFRLFPYLKEFRLVTYNEDHEKMKSVNSREVGGTVGLGIYINKALISELFIYTFRIKMYRDIAAFDDTFFKASGVGFKIYHDSLDDYVFPMRGTEIMTKFTAAKKDYYSDEGFKKFFSRLRIILPFSRHFSFKYQFEYGSYFKNFDIPFDPFYIGGYESFLGLKAREKSAPIYKINTLALRFRIMNRLFMDLQYNFLSLGNTDIWLPEEDNFLHGAGIKIGYDSLLGPLRFAIAMSEEQKLNYYLSLGYEFDTFEFSRH
ncbi:MAG: patatin-like phospholipase family protein [Candidatus Cloacimonetes bacterium]|nr:patatin-like phospholipase family protein [Candidatus Cloacimonadota bacterium]